MVSAVFHSPLAPRSGLNAIKTEATHATTTGAGAIKVAESVGTEKKPGYDWRGLLLQVLPPLLGLALLVGVWALVSIGTKSSIPSPLETWQQALTLFSDPFYRKGPNDQGVGWNVLMSLERVALGFGLAAAVGIPAGFLIGRFTFLSRMFNRSSACCARCLPWPGYPSACWCSRARTRPPSGPSLSAPFGPWSSTRRWVCSVCRRTT